MWCSNCPFFADCEDPAQLGGGCDCDGADDYGVDPIDDYDDADESHDVDEFDGLATGEWPTNQQEEKR